MISQAFPIQGFTVLYILLAVFFNLCVLPIFFAIINIYMKRTLIAGVGAGIGASGLNQEIFFDVADLQNYRGLNEDDMKGIDGRALDTFKSLMNYDENYPDVGDVARKLQKKNNAYDVQQSRSLTNQQIIQRKKQIAQLINNMPVQKIDGNAIGQIIEKMKKKHNLEYKKGQAVGFVVQNQKQAFQQQQYVRKTVRDITLSFLTNIRNLVLQNNQFKIKTEQQTALQKLVGKQNVFQALRDPQKFFAKHAIVGKQIKYNDFFELASKYHQFVTIAKQFLVLQGKLIKKQKLQLQMAFKLNQNTIMIPTQKPDIYIKANKSGQQYAFQKAIYKAGSFLNEKQLQILTPQAKKLILEKTKQFLQFKKYKGKKVSDQTILKHISQLQQNIVKNNQKSQPQIIQESQNDEEEEVRANLSDYDNNDG